MQPTSTLIGPTTDPTQPPILTTLPPFSGPLDPNAPPFDTAWWASQPPPVAEMQHFGENSDDDPQTIATKRRDAALQLANEGFLVDWDIVGWGQGPYATMHGQRYPNGYTWVPSTGQPNVPVVPGEHVPGLPDYNPEQPYPPNSIVVSNNAAYYLPYQAPAPPPTEPTEADREKWKASW